MTNKLIKIILIIFLITNFVGCGKRADLERPPKIDGLEPANIE